MGTEGSFPGVKWPGPEAVSPLSSAEVKNAWRYTSTPQYVFLAWRLVEHRNFTLFYSFMESENAAGRKMRLACLYL
jgi:hypothetical protein